MYYLRYIPLISVSQRERYIIGIRYSIYMNKEHIAEVEATSLINAYKQMHGLKYASYPTQCKIINSVFRRHDMEHEIPSNSKHY